MSFLHRRGSQHPHHCAAQAEVMTPDAIMRTIACGYGGWGPKRRVYIHGLWHRNGPVRWRGRYEKPVPWYAGDSWKHERISSNPDTDTEKGAR